MIHAIRDAIHLVVHLVAGDELAGSATTVVNIVRELLQVQSDVVCVVESERMRSVAGTPSILLSMVRKTSIFCGLAAVPTSEGLNKRMRSTLPIRTPAKRTSDPSRKPFASVNRARKCR